VKLEEWEEAAFDAGEAIARDEKYGKAYALRGQARMTLENYDDACKDYSRASELEPESKAFKESLAQVRVWFSRVNWSTSVRCYCG
jgi:cytochrome c-type biogenesis protein CcmH/NrfG